MLSNEWLTENADRINAVVDFAESMGDGAASLGTLIILSLSDEDYEIFQGSDTLALADLLQRVERQFNEAGIKTV